MSSRAIGLPREMLALIHKREYIRSIIDTYFYIPILVVGIFFNIVAALALWKRAKQKSTFNYLFALSIVDSFSLVAVTLLGLVRSFFHVDIQKIIDCNVYWLAVNQTRKMSSWFLVLASSERALLVKFPTKAKFWFTPKRARIAMLVTTAILLASNWLYFGGMATDKTTPLSRFFNTCIGRTPALSYYRDHVSPWVNIIMFSFLPFLCLLISNGVIIREFFIAKKR